MYGRGATGAGGAIAGPGVRPMAAIGTLLGPALNADGAVGWPWGLKFFTWVSCCEPSTLLAEHPVNEHIAPIQRAPSHAPLEHEAELLHKGLAVFVAGEHRAGDAIHPLGLEAVSKALTEKVPGEALGGDVRVDIDVRVVLEERAGHNAPDLVHQADAGVGARPVLKLRGALGHPLRDLLIHAGPIATTGYKELTHRVACHRA